MNKLVNLSRIKKLPVKFETKKDFVKKFSEFKNNRKKFDNLDMQSLKLHHIGVNRNLHQYQNKLSVNNKSTSLNQELCHEFYGNTDVNSKSLNESESEFDDKMKLRLQLCNEIN